MYLSVCYMGGFVYCIYDLIVYTIHNIYTIMSSEFDNSIFPNETEPTGAIQTKWNIDIDIDITELNLDIKFLNIRQVYFMILCPFNPLEIEQKDDLFIDQPLLSSYQRKIRRELWLGNLVTLYQTLRQTYILLQMLLDSEEEDHE